LTRFPPGTKVGGWKSSSQNGPFRAAHSHLCRAVAGDGKRFIQTFISTVNHRAGKKNYKETKYAQITPPATLSKKMGLVSVVRLHDFGHECRQRLCTTAGHL